MISMFPSMKAEEYIESEVCSSKSSSKSGHQKYSVWMPMSLSEEIQIF